MSTTENTRTEPDMATIWKIATPRTSRRGLGGAITGSALDRADGFIHSSNGPMVKKVARMFFADVGDAMPSRCAQPSGTGPSGGPRKSPRGEPPDDGSVLIHYLPDGCSHVFSAEPIPVSFVSERHPMPLVDGAHVFPRRSDRKPRARR